MKIRHTIRTKNSDAKEVTLTFKSAIRAFCAECCGWVETETRRCTAKLCPLWPFRCSGIIPVDPIRSKRTASRNGSDALKLWRDRQKQSRVPKDN